MVSSDVGEAEDGDEETRKEACMSFLEGKSGGDAYRVVIGVIDAWELYIPICLLFVPDHGEHQTHRRIDALNAAVGAGIE